MPGQRLPMRKIRDVLRLRAGGMSKRKIAASLSIGVTAAGDCMRRARRAGLKQLGDHYGRVDHTTIMCAIRSQDDKAFASADEISAIARTVVDPQSRTSA